MTRREYLRARRDDARAAGRCVICQVRGASLRADGSRMSRCDQCASREHNRRGYKTRYDVPRSEHIYEPLDCLIDSPRVRILRCLVHFDWASRSDIMIALDLSRESIRYRSHVVALENLCRDGHVESSGDARSAYCTYRITPAGRSWLAKQLARADVGVATEEEAA